MTTKAKKTKKAPKVGEALHVPVETQHIQNSDPCNKDSCMFSLAAPDHLVANFGGSAGIYHVKSTNHGCTFIMNGRRFIGVFDHNTARRIYNYDAIYTRTRSKEKARASVKPFKCRLMIEATQKIPTPEPLTEERKKYLRSLPRKKEPYSPKKGGSRRALSL